MTKVEIRNLYEIALCLFYLDQKDLADIIIQVLVQNLNTKWEFYGNILSLYAINFSRDENLSQALYYINQTIDFFHTNLYFKNLPLCYYNRSRIKSHLNDSTYKDDLIVALNLSDLLSQDYIADVIKDKCKKFNISL
ncbi:MAG: hypothetical protein Q4E36_04805 [Bacillota bacterium]|nr:hypothetical protein [Bacillota bacterium]